MAKYCAPNIQAGDEIYVGVDTTKSIFDDYKTAKYHKLTDFILGEVFRQNATALGWTPNDLLNRKALNKLIAGIRDKYENALIASANENENSPFWEMSDEAYLDIEENIIPNFEQFIGHYLRFNSIINNVQAALDEGTLDLTGTQDDTSVEEDQIGSSDEKNDSQGPKFERPGNDISAIDMASRMTKLIFRLIPKAEWNPETETVELFKDKDGLPTTADFGPVFNLLLNKLSGTKSYEELIEGLTSRETVTVVPEAQYVAEILKTTKPDSQRSISEFRLMNEFYQQFSKPKIQIQSALRQRNNNFTVVDEISGNLFGIKEQFTSNFQTLNVNDSVAQYIKEDELQGAYLDNTKVIPKPGTLNEQLDFLSLLGIKFTGTQFLDSEAKQQDFEDMVDKTVDLLHSAVVTRMAAGEVIRNPLEQLRSGFTAENGRKFKGEKSSIDELIAFESKYSKVTPSLSTRTANGELAYLISLDNQLSIVTYHLNNSQTLKELMSTAPFRTAKYNPLFRNSFIIQFLFDEEGNKRLDAQGRTRRIDLTNLSGSKTQSDERTISKLERDMSSKTKFIQDFNMMLLEGKTDVIRPEVSFSFFTVSMKNFDDSTRMYFGADKFLTDFKSNSGFKRVIHNYLTAEIQRVNSYDKKKEQNPNLPASYGQFSIFYETLEQENTALRDELKTSGAIDIDSPLFDKFMTNYQYQLGEEVGRIKNEINVLGIGEDELYSENLRDTINKNLSKDEALSENDKDSLIRAFVANTLVQNIEFATLYGIDPLYTNAFHKRLKGISSTGDLAATHSLFTEFRESPYEKNFHDKYSISGAIGKGYRNNDKNFQTKTLVEYRQAQGKAWAYTDDKIIDDIIASVTKRDGGETIFSREFIVNELLNKRESQKPADGQGYISLDFHRELSLRHGYNNDNIEVAYKYEGLVYRRDIAGKKLTQEEEDELELLEARIYKDPNKYSIPVLKFTYWGGIENTTIDTRALDKLSVAPLLPSDVKNHPKLKKLLNDMTEKQIGYVKYESGTKLYTTTPVDLERVGQVEPDLYSTELLKMQIRPKTTQNDSTSIPTQLLKLIFSNLFSNGKPVTERAGQLYQSYVTILKKIQGLQGTNLLDELGITSEGVNMTKLSERLIKQAEKQELNSNVINALRVEEGSLKGVLEESGFVKQIIDLVSGLADSRLRRWQMPGGDFVLVSNANRSKLNFYKYSEDGTMAADIRITLNGEFVKLLNRKHPDGKSIGTIDRLNKLLADDNWREENKKSLTLVMGRVPIQGPNSMEFGLVKEFLPPTIGNVIILPDEIVFKAGLDFDYDKEKVMTPSFTKDGRYIENVEGAQAEIDAIKAERKGVKSEYYNSKNVSESMVKIRAEIARLRNILEAGEFDTVVARISDPENKKKFNEGMEQLETLFTEIVNLEIARDSLEDLVKIIDNYDDYDTPVDKFPSVPDARFEGYIANEADNLQAEIDDTIDIFYTELKQFTKGAVFNAINEGLGFRNRILAAKQLLGKDLQQNFNNLVDLYKETLSLPEMFAELVTPNSTKTIDKVINHLTDINGETIDLPAKNKVFNYLDNLHTKDILFAAKNMMSPFAVDNTYMQIMQYLGVNINGEYKRKWGKNKETGLPKYVDRKINHILLSDSELEQIQEGKVIKSSLRDDLQGFVKQHYDSEGINITIDAAKDPRFALLNIDWNNIGVLNFMKNMGYPFARVVDFLNQPILLKYLEYRKNGLNKMDAIYEIGKLLDITQYKKKSTLMPQQAYKKLKNNPSITITKEERQKDGRYAVTYEEPTTPSVWDMMSVLRDIDNQLPIKPAYKTVKKVISYETNIPGQLETRLRDEEVPADDFNLRVFAHFVAMDEHNSVFRNIHYYFNNDRTKTSTPTDLKNKDDLRAQLFAQKMFSKKDIERMEKESIISAFMNESTLKKIYEAILPVIGREDVQATLDKLYRGYATTFTTRNARDLRNMPKILTSDFITAVLFNFNVEDGKTFLQRNKHLLIYDGKRKTISKRLDALRKQPFYPKLAKQFPVLDQFVISNHTVKSKNDLNGLAEGTVIKNIKLVKPVSETSIEEESTIDQLRSLMTYKIKDRKYSKEDRKLYTEALHNFIRDLFNVGLLQSGMDKTQIGFSEYIPTEYKRELFAPALQRFENSSPASFSNFLAKFESQFRYNNPKYFPSVKDDVHTNPVKNNNDYSHRFKIYDATFTYVLDDAEEDLGEEDGSQVEPEVVPTPIDTSEADRLAPIEQNFTDGQGGRNMQPQFKGKSTMDLIISGDRTRTTRAKTDINRMIKDYKLSRIEDLTGRVVRMSDKVGRVVYARITGVFPLTQEYQDRTWQKEGWVKEVTDKLVGKYPYAIEFQVIDPTKGGKPVQIQPPNKPPIDPKCQ